MHVSILSATYDRLGNKKIMTGVVNINTIFYRKIFRIYI